MSNLPVISTERLTLRPWTPADVDALHALWTHPSVRRYLWDDEVISRQQAADIVHSVLESKPSEGIGFWAVEKKSEPGLAGFCGFRAMKDSANIELLYGLRPDLWGLGLATEASVGALQYFWKTTDIKCVYAETDVPNHKSIEVMRRLGMRFHSTESERVLYVLERPELSASVE